MTAIDLQPTLVGKTITLRPLRSEDFAGLYLAASEPAIWELHPDSGRYKRDVFEQRFFQGAITSGGALAVEERSSGRIIGSSRYYEWDSAAQEIAIGYTFIDTAHWGTGTNGEMKALMLDHIFQQALCVWFHVGKTNHRSRRAVEKLGAVYAREEDRELDGKPYVQQYFRLPERFTAKVRAIGNLPHAYPYCGLRHAGPGMNQ